MVRVRLAIWATWRLRPFCACLWSGVAARTSMIFRTRGRDSRNSSHDHSAHNDLADRHWTFPGTANRVLRTGRSVVRRSPRTVRYRLRTRTAVLPRYLGRRAQSQRLVLRSDRLEPRLSPSAGMWPRTRSSRGDRRVNVRLATVYDTESPRRPLNPIWQFVRSKNSVLSTIFGKRLDTGCPMWLIGHTTEYACIRRRRMSPRVWQWFTNPE